MLKYYDVEGVLRKGLDGRALVYDAVQDRWRRNDRTQASACYTNLRSVGGSDADNVLVLLHCMPKIV